MVTLPRLLLAAPTSDAGKTTVAVGLMAALRLAGLRVAGAKVGPDYIDPGYHALATGRPGRNLDPWLCGEERIVPLLLHGAADADVCVVEGVMGLFDGRLGTCGFGSSAHVARLVGAPVVLVVDAAHTARTAAAVVHGLATYEPGTGVAGVILNRVGSPRALAELRGAIEETGVPVLGAVPRTDAVAVPARHLGLVPAAERAGAEASVAAAGRALADHVDLDAVLAVARTAPALDADPWDPRVEVAPVRGRPRIAVAAGRAFTFRYAEATEMLEAAGCEVVLVDPLVDPHLPEGTAGLYLGGGFPEVHAEELARNASLRADVAAGITAGLPTVAECAGLLYLAGSLDGLPMAGALPVSARMGPRLTLRYDEEAFAAASVVARPGEPVRFHEFHRTLTEPAGDVLTPTVHASYRHVHWAGHPEQAQRFADAAARFAGTRWAAPTGVAAAPPPDLNHHGDADTAPGLVDLAVNVSAAPPAWLAAALGSPAEWTAYPDAREARSALAARHGVAEESVLPTAGAAEAFTLAARGLGARRPVVVHPQFTEPEAALRRAGLFVRRAVLPPPFILDPALVPEDADLVVVGNPTNPTGVLHARESVLALRRPGRTLLVDEAFMDYVDGEPDSLVGDDEGVLVVRSLTKMWGLAGVRAGYVVGDPALIGRLAAQQSPWSVPTPALRAMVACASPRACSEASEKARAMDAERGVLVAALGAAGFLVVGHPRTPFVLVDTSPAGNGSLREALAAAGLAVRRGESFPGLGPNWIRVAVRDAPTSRDLAATLASLTLRREEDDA